MSAIAYYFAKKISAYQNVPIGLINLAIGGAPIETFISTDALQKSSQFAEKVQGNWLTNTDLPEWIRQRGSQNLQGHLQGYGDELGLNHAYKPGFAYASGIVPLLSFPIKGVLWYQGESNSLEAARVNEYKALMHLLITSYREGWHQQRLPFYWVQLSSIDTPYYHSEYWPQFRDLQRQLVQEIKGGGMAVCSDLGFKKDVHPTNKKDIGERLARWALAQDYGVSLVPSGPLPVKAKYSNGKVIISFTYVSDSLTTADAKALRGFSLDGKTEINAVISKGNINIPAKDKPQFVYYGWKPFTDANLVNADRLPASTFKIKVQ
jgi:sialate O-acetylesterase